MSKKHNRYKAARRRRRLRIALIVCILLVAAVVAMILLMYKPKNAQPVLSAEDEWSDWENWDGEEESFEFGDDSEAIYQEAFEEGYGEGWDDETLLDDVLTEPETPVVVAEYSGGTVMSDVFVPRYNNALTNAVFAIDDVDAETLKKQTVDDIVSEAIQHEKAEALGLTALTEADKAEIETYSTDMLESMLEYYMLDMDDIPDDEKRRQAIARLENEDGLTAESILAEITDSWWMTKLFTETVKDITVSEDDLKTMYDTLLSEQKPQFSASPEELEYAHDAGDPIVYYPAGYRAVRNLMIALDSEAQSKLLDYETQMQELEPGSDAYAALQAQIDALYTGIEAKAEEITQRLSAGESFDSLAEQFNEDEDSMIEPLRSQGYYLSADSYLFSDEFVQGSLELTEPGEVSAPLRSYAGVHLVQYIGELPEGEVPFETVRESLSDAVLENKQADYYETCAAQWLKDANIQYHLENLK